MMHRIDVSAVPGLVLAGRRAGDDRPRGGAVVPPDVFATVV